MHVLRYLGKGCFIIIALPSHFNIYFISYYTKIQHIDRLIPVIAFSPCGNIFVCLSSIIFSPFEAVTSIRYYFAPYDGIRHPIFLPIIAFVSL